MQQQSGDVCLLHDPACWTQGMDDDGGDDGIDLGDDSTDDDDDEPSGASRGRGKAAAQAAAAGDSDGEALSDTEDDEEEAAKEDEWAAPRAGKFAANVAAMVRRLPARPSPVQSRCQILSRKKHEP